MSDRIMNVVFGEGKKGLICRRPEDGGAWIVPSRRGRIQPTAEIEYRIRVSGETPNGNLRFADVIEESEVWRSRLRAKIVELGATQRDNTTIEIEGVSVQFTLLGPDWVDDGTLQYRRVRASWLDKPRLQGLPSKMELVLSSVVRVPLTPEDFGWRLYESVLGRSSYNHQTSEKFDHLLVKLRRLAEQVEKLEKRGLVGRINWPREIEGASADRPFWLSSGQSAMQRWLGAEGIFRGSTNLRDLEAFEVPDLSELIAVSNREAWERLVGGHPLTRERLAELAGQAGSEKSPLGAWESVKLEQNPEAGVVLQLGGDWFVAVAGVRKEGCRGDYGGLYARWVRVPAEVCKDW